MKKILLTLAGFLAICTLVFPQAPGVAISPTFLNSRLLPGNDTTVTTHIYNNTASDLSFSFPGFTTTRGSGGPDGYGYRWIDSDEENVPYQWTEISLTGTEVTGLSDDNRVGPFDIGFDFPYYNHFRSQFWINSNGVIQFSDQNINFVNMQIPTNNGVQTNFIAALWRDLNFQNNDSKAYYQQFSDRLVIQFEKAYRYGFTGWATFQVALKADGTILLSYKELTDGFNPDTHTIGIQSSEPGVGLQVSYNQPYLHNDLTVQIYATNETGNFVTNIDPPAGVLPANTMATVTLTYSAVGYEPGSYQQTVLFTSDNPDYDTLSVYNLMMVSAQPKFYGTVTDAETGAALEGVTVTAGEYTTMTGPLGHYDMIVAPGTYDLQFAMAGYDTAVRANLSITLDQTIEISQALVPDNDFILGGTVFAGIYQLDMGYVNAFETVEGQVVDIFADLIDTLGYYNFPSLMLGNYLVKAEPSFGSIYEGDYLPTYYGDVVHWADAVTISLTQNLFNADINLVAASLNNSNGPGKISGYIYQAGETKSGNSAVPAADIPVFLKQGNDHAMATSNGDGYFEFDKLEYGTYTMFAELFGKNSEFRDITINQTNEVSETNNLFIYAADILYGTGDNLPAGVQSVSLPYPNPSTSQASLIINLLQPKNLKLELFNGSGQSVSVINRSLGTGVNEVIVPVANLKSGIYWLQISDETGAGISRKLIRK